MGMTMRKIAHFVTTSVTAAVLTACGGGGGSGTPDKSIASSATNTVVEVPYFVEVPNALNIEYPYTGTGVNIAVLDISGDGRDDIVVHQIGAASPDTNNVGNIPCKNVLKVFIMQPDNTFSDQTVSYLQGNDLGACSRKIKVADVNGDKKLDVIYALNQEDGRSQINAHDMNAQNAVLLSNGSTYSIKKFGQPSWYHSVGVGYDRNDRIYVAGAGYTGRDVTAYYFDHPTLLGSSPHNISNLSPNAFELFTNSKTKKHTNLLLQTSNTYPNYTTAEGFVQNDNGVWNKVGQITFMPLHSIASAIGWTGGPAGDTPVFRYKDYFLTFAGMSETCKIKLTPDGDPVVLFSVGGAVIPNYTAGNVIKQTDLKKAVGFFKAATIINNEVKEVPITIENEQPEYNSNFFDCKDVNGDGYDDIVRYPFSPSGLPLIYINNKNNGFTYYGMTNLPNKPTGWNTGNAASASSILHDFDKDGYMDLLVFAAQDVPSYIRNITYKFYRGQKKL